MVELLVASTNSKALSPSACFESQSVASVGQMPSRVAESPPAPELIMATDSSISVGWAESEGGGPPDLNVRVLRARDVLPTPRGRYNDSFYHIFTGMSTHYNETLSLVVVVAFGCSPHRGSLKCLEPGECFRHVAWCRILLRPGNSGPASWPEWGWMQATYGSNESWKTIVGTEPFSCGRNHWEIESSSTAYSHWWRQGGRT